MLLGLIIGGILGLAVSVTWEWASRVGDLRVAAL